ncbi:hypothetical protein [Mesobacillus harenae]|uniref:hypothetical protein n=1 Tax=Mesobacillus harenae TaxID=2213203 RepID=UPI00157FF0E3|nr:hypothetical protein [Mesobacillus harenae]
MSEATASVALLTAELRNRWRLLLGELKGTSMELFDSEKGEKLFAEMIRIHNKLALASVTQERSILAVTGLQGAGKTTIVKRLYDLDDRFLPENESRGEQIPVLITESAVEQPQGYLYVSKFDQEKGFHLANEAIDDRKFKEVALNPSDEHIWLELKVPNKYFFDEKKSLALLPGFERDQTGRSQQLLTHLLYLSTSSVVVFKKDTYARKSTVDMLQLVKDLYTEVKPIFVLSRGDENSEQNEEIRQQVAEDFAIHPTEANRVLVSGVYPDNEQNDEWQRQFISSIQKYSYISDEGQKKQLAMIDELCMDVRRAADEISAMLQKQEDNYLIENNGQSSPQRTLEQFELFYKHLLSQLERDMKGKLQERLKDARTNFNQYVKDNTGFWQNLTSKFSAKALEQQEKLEEAIKEAWMEAGSQSPEWDIIDVTTNHIDDQSKRLNLSFEDDPVRQAGTRRVMKIQPLAEKTAPETLSVPPLKEVKRRSEMKNPAVSQNTSLKRIDQFFMKEQEGQLVSLERDDLKVMTLMGTMLCRQALVAQPLLEKRSLEGDDWEKFFLNKTFEGNPLDKTMKDSEAFTGHVDKLAKLAPTLLKSIPLILGLDVAIDGEANLLINAASALSALGIALTPVQLIGIIGGAFAFAYGINAVQKAVHETNQRQLQLAQAGHRALDQLPEIQTQSFISALQLVFEKMGEQLLEKHQEEKGLFDDFGKLEKLQYSLRHIRNTNGQLHKLVYDRAVLTL